MAFFFGCSRFKHAATVPKKDLVVSVNSDIHLGAKLPNYAYEPASEIAHFLTRILSPDHVAPAAVKVRGSRVKPLTFR